MNKKVFLIIAALGVMATLGCEKKYPQIGPLQGDFVADFSKGEAEEIFASDGWSNGLPFNAVWTKENVTYSDGQMHLSIKNEKATADEIEYPHTAGEARSHKLYGYGDFEVRMKPSKAMGSVSTFFTYTDKWNKVNGVENRHDEIDIEFLGKDTTKVQFNYFVNGVGGHEHMYKLGFDASKEFHNYGFRWEKDCISWLVDGKTVYQVKASEKNPLPEQSGRILMSYWPSSIEGWSGKFVGPTTETTDYEWVKSSANTIYADGDEPVAPIEPGEDGVKWDEIAPTAVDLSTGSSYYTVNKNEGITTVTYESAGNWSNVVGTGANDVINANNLMNVKLKNNSASKSVVRVDVQGTTKIGDTDCLNVSATAEGHTEIHTDTQWGGSKIELAASEEVNFIIKYDVTTERGAAKDLLFFLDSLQESDVAHPGGSISISEIKFANDTGAVIEPVIPEEPPVPTGTPKSLSFGTENPYTLTPSGTATTSLNVTYTEIGGSSYYNFGAGLGGVENTTQFAVTIKNNGSAVVQVRVDIQGSTQVGNTKTINTSARAEGHSEVSTDTEWGGSKLDVVANEEVVFVVTFDQTTTRGAAQYLMFFVDSSRGNDQNYAGNITLSNFIFA